MRKKISVAIVWIIIVSSIVNVFSIECVAQNIPGIPTDFVATAMSRTRIDLTWMKGENADRTYIERNTTSPWIIGEGTPIYNDTGASLEDTGLSQNSHYYYQAWSWNQTDHVFNTTFTSDDDTTFANQLPVFSEENPADNAGNIGINTPSVSILIQDPDSDVFDWTIQGQYMTSASANGASNGTKSASLITPLPYSMDIIWYVNVTDGSGWTRMVYNFMTRAQYTPGIPTGFTAIAMGKTRIDLAWTKDVKADTTYIERNLVSSWNKDEGTMIYNSTGTSYSDTSLSQNVHYYYQAWSWNTTDYVFSNIFATANNTTFANQSPFFGTPSPENLSTNNPVNFSWNISIYDAEGDLFSWIISCSNGQTNSGIGATNGTKSLALSGLVVPTTYKVWVNATDLAGSNLWTRGWFEFSTEQVNNSPVFGTTSPTNGSTGNSLSFSWSIPINDLEGDLFSWTIQCSNGQNNSGTAATNETKSLALSGLAYSTTYKIWVNATDPTGSGLYTRKWYTFTTKSYDGGGGGGGGGGEPPVDPQNKKPVANASAGEPYQGYVNSEILFDGSRSLDSDGNITKWFWVFGDNTNGTGKTVRHTYLKAGTYMVTLTVTDDDGATNSDTTSCLIKQQNRPPTKPIVTGPTSGTKNTLYTYTALSTDADNDTINYTFDWDESVSQSSGFLPNASVFTLNHSWETAGRYEVTVIVTDNQTVSNSSITVYIDALQTRGAGYLVDNDGDGIYDAFYSDISKLITVVEKKDDSYLIDGDGDGVWDYMYNATNGITSYLSQNTPGFEIICIVGAIALVMFWKRKRRDSD